MKKILRNKKVHTFIVAAAIAAGVSCGAGLTSGSVVLAAEPTGYFDEQGNWVEEQTADIGGAEADISIEGDAGALSDEVVDIMGEGAQPQDGAAQTEASQKTGTYTLASGWSVDNAASTQERTVYKQDAKADQENTSTITFSYLDTSFSVLEYEQLRDMLTNNLLYSNVNAQLSSSAVYTDAKDYLYILIVDDASAEYRDIYCYVVGDYRCFCVEVREYRSEADELRAQKIQTPQEVGQEAAEGFVWN